MYKWESVKLVQYFCDKLDFVNKYNLRALGLVVLEQCIMMLCLTALITWYLPLSIVVKACW